MPSHKFEKLDKFDYEDELGIQEEYTFGHSVVLSVVINSSPSSHVSVSLANITSIISASACGVPNRRSVPIARLKYSDPTIIHSHIHTITNGIFQPEWNMSSISTTAGIVADNNWDGRTIGVRACSDADKGEVE